MQVKKLKTKVTWVLALFFTLLLALPARAQETMTITINNASDRHEYYAYQIFKGTKPAEAGQELVLTNLEWGTGVKEAAYTESAQEKAAALANEADAKAFAEELVSGAKLTDVKTASVYDTENKNYKISGLEPGYYLITDQAAGSEAPEAYSRYILKVAENTTINPKADVPSFEKKVKDINDSSSEGYSDWQDAADHDIGDEIPFRLSAKLPANFGDYQEKYVLSFQDTAKNLKLKEDSVRVYISDGENAYDLTAEDYTVTTSETQEEDGNVSYKFTVETKDLIGKAGAAAGNYVYVEYKAELTESAVIGAAGNPNKAYLEYSNNPNTGQSEDKGKTPEDQVIVFTYKLLVNKVDEESNPLAGAAFTLSKKNSAGEYTAVKTISSTAEEPLTEFAFKGLDDGEYRLEETVTPDGYNTIDPIEFTISAEHDVTGDAPVLIKLNGTAENGLVELTDDLTAGSLSANVINAKGTELPGTGGIGTKIFYAGGAVLMLSALVILFVYKNKKREEE